MIWRKQTTDQLLQSITRVTKGLRPALQNAFSLFLHKYMNATLLLFDFRHLFVQAAKKVLNIVLCFLEERVARGGFIELNVKGRYGGVCSLDIGLYAREMALVTLVTFLERWKSLPHPTHQHFGRYIVSTIHGWWGKGRRKCWWKGERIWKIW